MYKKIRTWLKKIRKPKTPKVYDYDPKLFKITKGVLVKYRGKSSEVTIPQCVKVIGNNAFDSKMHVKTVLFLEGVTTIKSEAFEDCRNLEKVELPNTLKVIEEEAFEGCTSLKNLTIPSSVEYIGKCAFGKFKKEQVITIMADVANFSRSYNANCRATIVLTANDKRDF